MRAWLITALAAAGALACAPSALARSSDSSNWAGYAVHRSGVSFRTVSGSWQQPTAACVPGRAAYSAYWVGLGGFSPISSALEQIGTEVDCTASGRVASNAWYELVPAPSVSTSFDVQPGDKLHASVTVIGHRVTVSLYDATRHRTFHKTVRARSLDVSSAEWIVEAPSDCIGGDSCQTLPLADFGAATFQSAKARTTTGHSGAISDSSWRATRIRLTPGGRAYVVYHGSGPSAGAATPSALARGGTSFRVTYQQAALAADRLVRLVGRLFH